jgi:hypothetical protein
VRIGVVSDTHDRLPAGLFRALEGVDEILHAGDLVSEDVLIELGAVAPVVAVHGNMDPPGLAARLPAERLVERDGVRVAIEHGHRRGRTTVEDFAGKYGASRPDLVVFGHTHEALSREVDGVRYFNPGTAGGVGAEPTIGILTIADGRFSIEHVAV